ncbi:MAG: tRNA (adenosine(37)-N6)-dimethylallyltransferase MiaA [bacterium]|nr:tRNA (adenosine(37)-N6)-dimethylallyltransferase MiaA [bacterium]
MESRPLVVIAGPTGIGKTDVAHQLAMEMNGEIVSADSRQIYRYLDIGTAKPSLEFRSQTPYHMVDIVDPDKDFSVANFKQQAEIIIDQIHLRGKLPFLVGGTGLYIKSIVSGLFPSPPPLPCFRQQLQEEASRFGTNHLYQRLLEIDPETASKISGNDLRRIIRALEVYHQTGKPISYLQRSATTTKDYSLIMICLNQDRQHLYAQIEQRVDRMIEMGWVEEVRRLLEKGYSSASGLISMEALGYQQIIKYLQGIYSLKEAISAIKQSSRQFAKRQITWFKADPRYNWFEPENIAGIRNCVKSH